MRTFGHNRPIRDKQGDITGQKEAPVKAITIDPLGGSFGADKERKLIVILAAGDVIKFKLQGSPRFITVLAKDAYRMAIDREAMKIHMKKMGERKAVIAAKRERAKLDRDERRFKAKVRRENEK